MRVTTDPVMRWPGGVHSERPKSSSKRPPSISLGSDDDDGKEVLEAWDGHGSGASSRASTALPMSPMSPGAALSRGSVSRPLSTPDSGAAPGSSASSTSGGWRGAG